MIRASDMNDDQRFKKHNELRTAALAHNGGDRGFRQWKASALAEVVNQANRSPRMLLLAVSLHGDLDIVVQIDSPVPVGREVMSWCSAIPSSFS
jgi:hypothetical protein